MVKCIKWGFTAARSENCREQSIEWRIEILHWRGSSAFERSKDYGWSERGKL